MKHRNYITDTDYKEFEIELIKNFLGGVTVQVVDKKGNRQGILCFDTCGMISLFPFKSWKENKNFRFRLDRRRFIKQQ